MILAGRHRFPPLLLLLVLAPSNPAWGISAGVQEPHPETQLLSALDALQAGRLNEAWQSLERLVQQQPNFLLARWYRDEVQAARQGTASHTRLDGQHDPAVQELMEEARLRQGQWRTPVPAGWVPDAVLQLSDVHRYAAVVDLVRARLYLLENRGGTLSLSQHYYAAIGRNGARKQTTRDQRTPIGVYRITGFIRDEQLPELYGAGAFPVDYPNAWDRHLNRTGTGIWVHGVPRDTYSRAPRSSEGCITLANADLLALRPFLVPGETPVVFSDTLSWQPPRAAGTTASGISATPRRLAGPLVGA